MVTEISFVNVVGAIVTEVSVVNVVGAIVTEVLVSLVNLVGYHGNNVVGCHGNGSKLGKCAGLPW